MLGIIFLDLEDYPDHLDIQNRVDVVRIEVDEVEQSQCVGKTSGRVYSLEELKIYVVMWLKTMIHNSWNT